MKPYLTMSLLRSEKPYEKRIAILPEDLQAVHHCDHIVIESGYGKEFGIADSAYERLGCHVVSKQEALTKDILCDTKIGEATFLQSIADHKILVGWIHAGADRALTDLLLKNRHTCYAWEDFYEDERHCFWRNNQIAGAGGVMNALQYTGYFPYGKKAGILGRGDSAAGAYYMLSSLGADVRQYSRKQEKLFIQELKELDIIVMAIRWDTLREDHLISSFSRHHMKKDAIIIDISDDVNGAIENSISSTIHEPIYYLDGIMVYSVSNVPSIYYKSATQGISKVMKHYIDRFIEQDPNEVMKNSIIIEEGKILDERIIRKQNR